jgi:hypothetical protein
MVTVLVAGTRLLVLDVLSREEKLIQDDFVPKFHKTYPRKIRTPNRNMAKISWACT